MYVVLIKALDLQHWKLKHEKKDPEQVVEVAVHVSLTPGSLTGTQC